MSLCTHEITVVDAICRTFPPHRRHLISILQEIQHRLGYVSEKAMDDAARYLNISLSEAFGVATFFSQFRFTPPAKHCLKICQGTACHVRGGSLLLECASRRFPGPVDPSAIAPMEVERVMCLGSCALAPAVVMDDTVHARMTQGKLDKLLEKHHES